LFSFPGAIWGAGQEDKMARAVQLFNSEKYEEADPIFRQLVDAQPENPMLNYYYGSCQTEIGIYNASALNHLLTATKGDAPLKVGYYLGIQYQAREEWEEALRHYNKFRIKTQKTEQDKLNLAEKIQQCYNHENPFLTVNAEADTTISISSSNLLTGTDSIPLSATDSLQNVLSEPDSLNMKEDLASGMPIEFIINSQITYWNTANFRTQEAKKTFLEANAKQRELDSSLKKADELREDYPVATSENEKKIIGEEILSLENKSYKLKEEVTQLLERSRNLENQYWQNAPAQEMKKFKEEAEEHAQIAANSEPQADTTQAAPDTSVTIDPNVLLNNLDVNKVTPEQQPEKDELVYKIQIGAYSKGLPRYVERLFKKLSLIRKIDHYTDENGITVYTTGNLTNLEDAIKMQNQVRQEGVEDAFVVPYFNGKRITLKQAKEIAKDL